MNFSRTPRSASEAPGLLYAGFNQDYSCFAVGLETGFRVYSCNASKELTRNESDDGGIALVEMLYRANYLALVGGGRNPRYPLTKVIIYDHSEGKAVLELEFKQDVRSVRLRRDRLVVVLTNAVYVYHFALHPKLLCKFDTINNPKGLAAVSAAESTPSHYAILAIPGRQYGHLQFINLDTLDETASTSMTAIHTTNLHQDSPLGKTRTAIIPAHAGELSCIALSQDGSKCATASDKGTLIRVFDTHSLRKLNELRRGIDHADIYSIAFNSEATRLCVSSDKGTIHVFNLDASAIGSYAEKPRGPTYGEVVVYPTVSPSTYGLTHSGNRGSSLGFMKDILPPYFSSEWSFAHTKIPNESRCIVTFGEERNTIHAICADGSFYTFSFDPQRGGKCALKSFERFLKQDQNMSPYT